MFLRTLLLLAAFAPGVAFAAVDFFLKIDGVPGESKRDGHEDEIDILGISWEVESGGRLACIEGIELDKFVDLSSALLLMGQAEGVIYPEAVLTAEQLGEDRFQFLVIKFERVYVSSYSTTGASGDSFLREKLTLKFDKATYTYTARNDDGSPGPVTVAELFARGRCR